MAQHPDDREPIFVGAFRDTLLRVRCICNHGNIYIDYIADDFVPTSSPQTTVTLWYDRRGCFIGYCQDCGQKFYAFAKND